MDDDIHETRAVAKAHSIRRAARLDVTLSQRDRPRAIFLGDCTDRMLALHTVPAHRSLMALWQVNQLTIAQILRAGVRIWGYEEEDDPQADDAQDGDSAVTSVRDTAARLRAATSSLPTWVVDRFAEELEATAALLSETLYTSAAHDDVLGQVGAIMTRIVEDLHELIGAARKSILDKAEQLAAETVANETGAPPHQPSSAVAKVEALRCRPRPRSARKDTNERIKALYQAGGAVEHRGGGHLAAYAPTGECRFISATPKNTAASNTDLDKLIAKAEEWQQKHQKRAR
ncbi:hypothetical protein SAMN05216215_101876 [Saccharopolyspora shandongensis]|uniref:Uncharacterized protein n=2 Tax=Saccharopolyspora shandongensis TaxID=418495 RepID=A0A1H3G9A1_9PSEU|nr:hypothetical protein SAMN05216215_101876 [Saccharopolyspora shandongensis]